MLAIGCRLKGWMCRAIKREIPSSKEFLDMSVFGYCPLEALAKDSVLCGRQKILVVFWRISTEAGLMVEFIIR
jgi:hypothetical protein